MVLDGNSIINRAFYGVKMLTTRDGTPTNAIYTIEKTNIDGIIMFNFITC